jgi:sulfatase modifying factor 1
VSVADDEPATFVTYDQALKFCEWLAKKEGKPYRLPTEAEWEYSCRAKSTGRFYFGDDEAGLKDYAWYNKNSAGKTQPVGQLKPNAWGLYDMHGNVGEWCRDWYGEYPAGPVTDPQGPDTGKGRVLRGGSWYRNSGYLRSAERGNVGPDNRNRNIGFRVARTF